jgi:Tol biopolymer transport system component
MNADGSHPQRLTNHPALDVSAIWSPDGSKITFDSNRDGNFEVYMMDADGTDLVNLTSNPADDGNHSSWRP